MVRIVQNRMADDGKKIFNELRSFPAAGSMAVRMSRNPKEHISSGNVKMDYHCKEVVIQRPQRKREKHLREKLTLTAIYVHESGKKGIEWFLLTTVKVKNEKKIEKLIQCYAHRWKGLEVLYALIAYRSYLVSWIPVVFITMYDKKCQNSSILALFY